MNDNGSGSMSLITMLGALLAAVPRPGAPRGQNPRHEQPKALTSAVRFCWWAGEELGLLGSRHYVDSVKASGEDKAIALNLNFDMLASPNFARGVYDGSDSSAQSPETVAASTEVMNRFESHFNAIGLGHVRGEFSGRSDYGPFLEAGIPAGVDLCTSLP